MILLYFWPTNHLVALFNGAPEFCLYFEAVLHVLMVNGLVVWVYYWISVLACCEEEPFEDKEGPKMSGKLVKMFVGRLFF